MSSHHHQPSGWKEIRIQGDPLAKEALCAFFYDMNCTGLIIEGDQDEVIRFYLPLDQKEDEFKRKFDQFVRQLKEIFPKLLEPVIKVTRIENQDWADNWRRFFKPDRITPNLFVFPAWEPIPEDIKAKVIRMDPGPAFGTGQHATTRLCLQTMENVPSLSSKSMLDVGTGSGILSIYGVLISVRRVVGIDIDQEALRWAERNIALNDLTGKIELSDKPLDELRETFNLIVANLTRDTILDLLPHINRLLAKRGYLILSGILIDQEEAIDSGLRAHSLKKESVSIQGEWICIQARKDKNH